jgi:hypothetical protein
MTSRLRSRARGRASTRAHWHLDQRGTTTVEYLVLMVCILGGCYALWKGFGQQIVAAISG